MLKINEYIQSFDFDYFETYSFNREEIPGKYTGGELLVDASGAFHSTAELKRVHTSESKTMLVEILSRPVVQGLRMLCSPHYRDSIVFYSKDGKIARVLNVCLSCGHMIDGKQAIDADYMTYDDLKRLFIASGHEVEQPEYFFEKDFAKYKK